MRLTLPTLSLLLLTAAYSQASPEGEVRATAQDWIDGIGAGDADYMVSLYTADAILHGTVSPLLWQGSRSIRDYFAASASNPPITAFVGLQYIRIFGAVAVNTGCYTTRIGSNEPLRLRYSFVYHQVNGHWLIVDHHSSRLP